LRLRNFRPNVESYVAAQGGPPPYIIRLREIDAATAAHTAELDRLRHALAAVCSPDERLFGGRWRSLAKRWRFDEVNDLIERHNRWFPVEARLPMDPRTGDFVLVAGRSYKRAPLDAAWILERFPPELP
jgi:hypothetical protein